MPLLPGDAGFSLPARCRCPCVFPPPCRRLRKLSLSRRPPFSPSNGASPDPGVRKRPSNPPSPAPRKMSPSPFFQDFPSATKCSDVTAIFFCRPSKKLSDRYVALSHALSRAVWAKNKSTDATAAKPSSANRDVFLDISRPQRARRRSPLGRRGLRTCGNAIASPGCAEDTKRFRDVDASAEFRENGEPERRRTLFRAVRVSPGSTPPFARATPAVSESRTANALSSVTATVTFQTRLRRPRQRETVRSDRLFSLARRLPFCARRPRNKPPFRRCFGHHDADDTISDTAGEAIWAILDPICEPGGLFFYTLFVVSIDG